MINSLAYLVVYNTMHVVLQLCINYTHLTKKIFLFHPFRFSPWMIQNLCPHSTAQKKAMIETKWWKLLQNKLQHCVTHLMSTLQSDTASMKTILYIHFKIGSLFCFLADFVIIVLFFFFIISLPRGPEENAKLANEIYARLDAHKADNPKMGEVSEY